MKTWIECGACGESYPSGTKHVCIPDGGSGDPWPER
jgi:hypothetical protein